MTDLTSCGDLQVSGWANRDCNKRAQVLGQVSRPCKLPCIGSAGTHEIPLHRHSGPLGLCSLPASVRRITCSSCRGISSSFLWAQPLHTRQAACLPGEAAEERQKQHTSDVAHVRQAKWQGGRNAYLALCVALIRVDTCWQVCSAAASKSRVHRKCTTPIPWVAPLGCRSA